MPTEKETEDTFKERRAKKAMGLHSAVLEGFLLQVFEDRLNGVALKDETDCKRLREAINAVLKTVFQDWTKAHTVQKKHLMKGRLWMFHNVPANFAS